MSTIETTRPVSRAASEAARLQKARMLILAAAGLSLLASVALWFLVDKDQGLFVGLWVPSILALGSLLLNGREVQA